MIYLGTDNRFIINKIIPYLEKNNINYTTNIFDEFNYVLLTDINLKTDKLINNLAGKNFVFLLHFEEEKIYNRLYSPLKNHIKYRSLLYKILYKCSVIYTSNNYIKDIIKKKIKTEINVLGIPLYKGIIEISRKELIKKYNIKKTKLILCIDNYYQNIDIMTTLLEKYPNYQFCYMGYTTNINKTDYKKLDLIKKKCICINNINTCNIYSLLQLSDIAINLNTKYDTQKISSLMLQSKTPSFIINTDLYTNSLINSKNTYIFKDEIELIKKLNKYFNERISNLCDAGYDFILNNSVDILLTKFNKYK